MGVLTATRDNNHQIIPVLNGTNPALNGTVRKPITSITSTGFGDTEGFLQPAALGLHGGFAPTSKAWAALGGSGQLR